MKLNVASWDRIARIVLGLGLMTLPFVRPGMSWGFVGIIPLVTGVIGFCPIYRIFGVSTEPHQAK